MILLSIFPWSSRIPNRALELESWEHRLLMLKTKLYEMMGFKFTLFVDLIFRYLGVLIFVSKRTENFLFIVLVMPQIIDLCYYCVYPNEVIIVIAFEEKEMGVNDLFENF